jgi:hypothetical protein
MKTKNHTTQDYGRFVHNDEQREIDDKHVKKLMQSMVEYGFLPSKPLQCYWSKDGKLVVVDGHHRLAAAIALGIPVHFVIETPESQAAMARVNQVVKKWGMKDFARLYASRGNQNYIKLLEYEDMGIPLTMAASMMYHHGAASGNAHRDIPSGKFSIRTTRVVDLVASVVHEFSQINQAAGSRAFIAAISKCVLCEEFDLQHFSKRLKENISMLEKTNNADQMLSLIETIYNFRTKDKKPIKFFVEAASKQRNPKGAR